MLLAAAAGVFWQIRVQAVTPIIDQYLSTGDNIWFSSALPLDTPAAINASFDMLKDVFGTRRIYWRGLQQTSAEEAARRPDSPVPDGFLQWSRHLSNDLNINEVAVQAAHARGMQIWGATSIADWGNRPDAAVYYGFPSDYESPLRADHPQWIPVDKQGVRQQSGPIELAYSDARTAITNWTMQHVNATGYDGVMLQTYAENFSQRFLNEFGFSDPIVNEFKARYGVDIRRQNFNRTDWSHVRGEYLTQMLSELGTQLRSSGKQLSITVNPDDNHGMQNWAAYGVETMGNIHADLEGWIQNHTVDNLVVWGASGNALASLGTISTMTQGSQVSPTYMTSSPYNPAWQSYRDAGIPTIGADGTEEDYLLASNIPVQPVSSLQSADPYKRMRVLAQITTGQTSSTAAAVLPLANDSNLLVRRMALKALAIIGNSTALPTIENLLSDPENSVRTAAMYALRTLNRSQGATPILNAIDANGNHMLMEDAVIALSAINPLPTAQLTSAAASVDPNVRSVAVRALSLKASSSMTPTFVNALNDTEPYVRFYAAKGLGNVNNDPSAVAALLNATTSPDVVVSDQAAASLSAMLVRGDVAGQAAHGEIVTSLTSLFQQMGDGTTRTDADWGFRTVGNALVDLGAEGVSILESFRHQRNDRRLSEQAWQVIYLPQRLGQFNLVTEAQNDAAFVKRPRWDKVVGISETFDAKAAGASIDGKYLELGDTWHVLAGSASDHIVQNAVSNGGNALKVTRRAGSGQLLVGSGASFETAAAEFTRVTLKTDWQRVDAAQTTVFGADLSLGTGAQVFAHPDSTYRVWQSDGTANGGSFVNTGVPVGSGGWETLELVLAWGSADDEGLMNGVYDVFLTRGAGNTLGTLSRMQIAHNIKLQSITEGKLQSLLIANQPNGGSDITTYWDNLSLSVAPLIYRSTWKADANGNWADASNWQGDVPGLLGSIANFGGAIAAPRVVTVDTPQSLSVINFDSAQRYTIGGAGTLTMEMIDSEASITVLSGSHTIAAPVVLAVNTTIGVNSVNSTLTLSGSTSVSAGAKLTKSGAGTLELKRLHADSVVVSAGALKVLPDGTNAGASRVKLLTLASSAGVWMSSLDLNDNALVIDYNVTPRVTVERQLASGYAGGSWTGMGITSSASARNANSPHRMALGIAEAAELFSVFPATFAGESIDKTSLLIRYTYSGDANLDGTVNSTDFNSFLAGYGTTANGIWGRGDFNFDRKVNTTDFNLLAANYGLVLSATPSAVGTVVPEPTNGVIISAAFLLTLHRKRVSGSTLEMLNKRKRCQS